jgi:hypothetical protein
LKHDACITLHEEERAAHAGRLPRVLDPTRQLS